LKETVTEEQIPYSAVLADLEGRRNALNTRISSIDAAIDGIRVLLDMPSAVSPANVVAKVAAPAFSSFSTRTVQLALPAAVQSKPEPLTPERRKKPGLNIYVNKYPEWSRQMSRGNLNFRKKAGLRCPKCGSSDTRDSVTRSISDFLMLLFDYSNARCRNCNHLFRNWKPRAEPEFAQIRVLE
jgi:hypothetical protein